ncbi:MAG: tRNA lysidine(34) synthetase TilS [Planctomycetota bacterium]|jgi:tRNA(Ile)-lysidine synthase
MDREMPPSTPEAPLAVAVAASLRDHGLGEGDVVVVAFSGGPDSTALLHALVGASRGGGPAVGVVAAHFDHALRRSSAEEAGTARSAALELGVPFVTARWAEAGSIDGSGVEHAARRARYDFLAAVVREHGARVLATAHHRDDRVETVLHRLLQGSRLSGLAGLPRSRPLDDSGGATVLRPLFEIPRVEVLDYVERHGLEVVNDPTNTGDANARARLRSRVLPALEESYPGTRESILRLEAMAREALDLLEREAADVEVERGEKDVFLPRTVFEGRGTEAVRFHLARMAVAMGPGRPDVPEAALHRVMDALGRDDGKTRSVPVGGGLDATVDGEGVRLSRG